MCETLRNCMYTYTIFFVALVYAGFCVFCIVKCIIPSPSHCLICIFLSAICSVIMLPYLVPGTPSPQITITEMPGICFPLCDSVWIIHVLLCTYISTSAFVSLCVVVENLEVPTQYQLYLISNILCRQVTE